MHGGCYTLPWHEPQLNTGTLTLNGKHCSVFCNAGLAWPWLGMGMVLCSGVSDGVYLPDHCA